MKLEYILKDARKNREDNRLYFYSLILVFIVSYTILSFDKSAISTFLYQENIFSIQGYLNQSYISSLIFLLTLIFFASKNQIDNRKDEFAILMMMGEKRKNISKRLSYEAIFNSLLALLIALPIAIFLNEFINLFVIKVLELGLKTHKLRISLVAVFVTSLVVIALQIICIRLISFFILRKEAYKLISGKNKDLVLKEKKINEKRSIYLGIFFLLLAVLLVIVFERVEFPSLLIFFLSLFFFYRGFPYILDKLSQKSLDNIFEIRLIEEKFKYEYKSLYFTNLAMLISFVLLTLPLTQSFFLRADTNNVPDFTIYDSKQAVDRMYGEEKYKKVLEKPSPFYLSGVDYINGEAIEISLYGENMSIEDSYEFLIKESSMNQILEKMGKEKINLRPDEAMMVYDSFDNYSYYRERMGPILEESQAKFRSRVFHLIPRIEPNEIFSNKEVYQAGALVVDDAVYNELAPNKKPYAYNLYIKSSYKNEEGTIKASEKIRDMMIKDGLKYESRIWQVKNEVSDLVIDLYTNLYLGLLLFIIANTYIAFKFLYWIKDNKERFAMKKLLGADSTDTRKRMEKIIDLYFICLFAISFVANFIYYQFNIAYVGDRHTADKFFVYINIALVIFELIYISIIKKITKDQVEKSR
ncbi:MAG: FtsX-like permease family protein [Anaerococcus sp.]|jgi:putative ABC transport system permease protein|nr:FtsX-like permease family protein [Peptoniphilaceae bacterium]MDY3056079.1 FtsX-like permease family protein [Anaerococcus sp.]